MMMMMMMEDSDQEEVVVDVCKDRLQQIIKSKRTKRTRPMSPLSLMTTSSSSGGGGDEDEDGRNSTTDDDSRIALSPQTTTTSADELSDDQSSTKEEEDMANCLILLAQGTTTELVPSTEPAAPMQTTTTTTAAGKTKTLSEIYVHQCKTCNRCFSSFQALGGHRASHKIKPNHNENNKGLMFEKANNNMNTTLSLQITNKAVVNSFNRSSKSNKVHECLICGAEFSSGQALGGHMRRHRTFTNSPTTTTAKVPPATTLSVGPETEDGHQFNKKPRTVLQLDLNLPAPDEDHDIHHREPKFSFVSYSKEKLLVFSASSLVDCHY